MMRIASWNRRSSVVPTEASDVVVLLHFRRARRHCIFAVGHSRRVKGERYLLQGDRLIIGIGQMIRECANRGRTDSRTIRPIRSVGCCFCVLCKFCRPVTVHKSMDQFLLFVQLHQLVISTAGRLNCGHFQITLIKLTWVHKFESQKRQTRN